MQTPYFLIHRAELENNIARFREAFAAHWPAGRLAYSVKTNSLPWLLAYLRQQDVLAEVVSEEEYGLALKCGFAPSETVYNGPIKTETSLLHALSGGAVVNLDSQKDLEVVCALSEAPAKLGLRVNLDLTSQCPEHIDYLEDGFRFGFSYENGELGKAIQRLRDRFGDLPLGLHLHCNSRTRAVEVYRTLAAAAGRIVTEFGLTLSFLDMGGGYFGGVPGRPDAVAYLAAIRQELEGVLDPEKVPLIVEPGSAIIGSAVSLVTSVVDVKDTARARIVTTDGSRLHIDPLWIKSRYLYTLKTQGKPFPRQVICGYTCMDHDRLMIIENQPELKVGDTIEYHKVGAYSMTLGGAFIRYFPDVYVQSGEELTKVRSRMTLDDYYHLHT